jgi:hypothetical protein
MASKGGAAPSTYTPAPTPTNKAQRPPFFTDSDVDWTRSDGRGFHQCRSACNISFPFYCLSLFFFFFKKKTCLIVISL